MWVHKGPNGQIGRNMIKQALAMNMSIQFYHVYCLYATIWQGPGQTGQPLLALLAFIKEGICFYVLTSFVTAFCLMDKPILHSILWLNGQIRGKHWDWQCLGGHSCTMPTMPDNRLVIPSADHSWPIYQYCPDCQIWRDRLFEIETKATEYYSAGIH